MLRNTKATSVLASHSEVDIFGISVSPWEYWMSVVTVILAVEGLAASLWQVFVNPGGSPSTAGYRGVQVWNVPFARNRNFTGRLALLRRLREELMSPQAIALAPTVALHGLGGVGKTMLAVEYCYRHSTDYQVIWWLRAEDTATLCSDYALLSSQLKLRQAQSQDDAICEVRNWLDTHSGWLLVLDDAPKPSLITWLLPQLGKGHIIITSRYSDWAGCARAMLVDVMELPDAAEFLLTGTKDKDRSTVEALAQTLGCLPLALAQARAYISATGMSFRDYQQLFIERQPEMMGLGKPEDYRSTIAATWNISIVQAARDAPAAEKILSVCSFLGAEPIPYAVIDAVQPDRVARNSGIAALRKYSLVDVTDSALVVHRLVQAAARSKLSGEDAFATGESALAAVDSALPTPTEPSEWAEFAQFLPHVKAVLAIAARSVDARLARARALNETGLYLRAMAQQREALPLLESAVAEYTSVLGDEHPSVATAINNLALVTGDLGMIETATSLHQRALAIRRRALPPDQPDIAQSLNNLALLSVSKGQDKGVEESACQALQMAEKALGPDHPAVAIYLNNLASYYQDVGRLRDAEPLYERALAIGEKTLGKDHPAVATRLNNLADLYMMMGRKRDAMSLCSRALAIMESKLGGNHPRTIAIRNNLAKLRA
ncbi:tetratricopeptide repeat protein [candidate division WOR-3 bacterium]|uniref:Tetratricopeptide repeat protein n=1 Tax=candidate division WOR-3 bacterium TaxID=2052148 RepID=A0A938BTH5_UNCW3|nr:tetratricopeptide repeat protein [candidate division WOR-3 bacterium]